MELPLLLVFSVNFKHEKQHASDTKSHACRIISRRLTTLKQEIYLGTSRPVRVTNHFANRDQFRGHGKEGLFDILCIFGTRFEKWDRQAVCKGFGRLVRHYLVVADIVLVTHEEFACAFAGIAIHFIQPVIYMIERFLYGKERKRQSKTSVEALIEGIYNNNVTQLTYLTGDIIYHDDTVCSTVIRTRDRPKSLLPCRVPLSHTKRVKFCQLSTSFSQKE